jgi:hypothetical protein
MPFISDYQYLILALLIVNNYQAKKITIAAASFNNSSYIKGKINIWQEIDWPKLSRESLSGMNNYDSRKLETQYSALPLLRIQISQE